MTSPTEARFERWFNRVAMPLVKVSPEWSGNDLKWLLRMAFAEGGISLLDRIVIDQQNLATLARCDGNPATEGKV